ncbi:diguanylate cyclase [Myxococcota bacterium]
MGAGLWHQRAARLATEESLREREQLINVVVDGAIDAIMTIDSHGTVASFNPAAEQMFGWPSAEIVGQSSNLLFTPEDGMRPVEGHREALPRINKLHRRGEWEIFGRRRDRSSFPILLSCSGPQRPGQNAVTAVARDLTLYRQNAKALEVANTLLEAKLVEVEERSRVITLLGEMSDLLQAAVTAKSAYAHIADYGRQLFPLDAGALCTVDPDEGIVEVVANWGELGTLRVFAPDDCCALSSGRAHTVDTGEAAAVCPHVSRNSVAGHTCVPIISQGEPLGIMCFRWDPEGLETGDASAAAAPFRKELAVAFANQVGLALSNLRLKARLRTQAIHDPLTGLHNRRYLDEAFHRELLRAARKTSPVGVLMLDLDHFKVFNDTHGHTAGDALLQAFAVQLRSNIRAEDVACRYGGEEFAVILPDATLGQALARAEQIREGMRKLTVDFQGRVLAGVTVSIGVAASPGHGESPDALLRAADAALYAAKADGRDRTKIAAHQPEPAVA